MKILYLSCHEVLEYDEIKLLKELGHDVFSFGAYVEERNKGNEGLRPFIGFDCSKEILDLYSKYSSIENIKYNLPKEFIEIFDLIIVMHFPDWIYSNWNNFRGKRVIWRTIGQSIEHIEEKMKYYVNEGLQIVRYSPREKNIPDFAGKSALIRFYKDPLEFNLWNGKDFSVINFSQYMEQREPFCGFSIFNQATSNFNRKLFGAGSESLSFGRGRVTREEQINELRNNRVYFYTGTWPASYTLSFIEAFLTGIPIVAIGPLYGNADIWRHYNLYEIPDFIENGVNGFISDNINELKEYIRSLLSDNQLASNISKQARETAIRLFSKDIIKEQWKEFLNNASL